MTPRFDSMPPRDDRQGNNNYSVETWTKPVVIILTIFFSSCLLFTISNISIEAFQEKNANSWQPVTLLVVFVAVLGWLAYWLREIRKGFVLYGSLELGLAFAIAAQVSLQSNYYIVFIGVASAIRIACDGFTKLNKD